MSRLTDSNNEIPLLINERYWLDIYFKLKEYEELEEQGLLLKLPCKVGDTVWHINEKITKQGRKKVIKFFVDNGEVDNIRLGSVMIPQITLCTSDNHWITFDLDEDWNKNIFLTKEEAEQELKRLERKNE